MFGVQDVGFRASGFGFRASGFGVWGLRFSGLGFRGLGFKVFGSGQKPLTNVSPDTGTSMATLIRVP